MTEAQGWYVCLPRPVGSEKLSRWGPYTLETAWAVQAALEGATGQYAVVKDADGNFPT